MADMDLKQIGMWAMTLMTIGLVLGVGLLIWGSLEQTNKTIYHQDNETQTETWSSDVLIVDFFGSSFFELQVNTSGGLVNGYLANNTIGLGTFIDPGTYYAGSNGTIAFIGAGTPDASVNVTYDWLGGNAFTAGTQNATLAASNFASKLGTVGTLIGVLAILGAALLAWVVGRRHLGGSGGRLI